MPFQVLQSCINIFYQKKDNSLQLVQDYRTLNDQKQILTSSDLQAYFVTLKY